VSIVNFANFLFFKVLIEQYLGFGVAYTECERDFYWFVPIILRVRIEGLGRHLDFGYEEAPANEASRHDSSAELLRQMPLITGALPTNYTGRSKQ